MQADARADAPRDDALERAAPSVTERDYWVLDKSILTRVHNTPRIGLFVLLLLIVQYLLSIWTFFAGQERIFMTILNLNFKSIGRQRNFMALRPGIFRIFGLDKLCSGYGNLLPGQGMIGFVANSGKFRPRLAHLQSCLSCCLR